MGLPPPVSSFAFGGQSLMGPLQPYPANSAAALAKPKLSKVPGRRTAAAYAAKREGDKLDIAAFCARARSRMPGGKEG
jgi:hypothetical protein